MNKPLPRHDLDDVVARCADLWPLLEGKRVFITGGTGFIGRWMIESGSAAIQSGCRVSIFSLDRPQDIRSFNFAGAAFDYIIHLAARDFPTADETVDVIVNGTRRVLSFAKESGCLKVLNASSVAAGITTTAYGRAKLLAESLCEASEVPCISARVFGCFGPGLPLNYRFAVGNFIRDAVAGRAVIVKSDGTAIRSNVYASDLAVMLWHLLLKGASGKPYDAGSPEEHSISEIAEIVAGSFSPNRGVQVIGTEKTDPGKYIPDTSRVENELGVRCEVPFADGVRRMAEWLNENIEIDGTGCSRLA